MRKLVTILLIGFYSVAIFAAGAVSFDCCQKSAAIVAADTDVEGNGNNRCDNTHSNIVFENHLTAAPVHHFTSRKFYTSQFAFLQTFAVSSNNWHPFLVGVNIQPELPSSAVPVYILNCVYRI